MDFREFVLEDDGGASIAQRDTMAHFNRFAAACQIYGKDALGEEFGLLDEDQSKYENAYRDSVMSVLMTMPSFDDKGKLNKHPLGKNVQWSFCQKRKTIRDKEAIARGETLVKKSRKSKK